VAPAPDHSFDVLLDDPKSVPLHECAEEVHAVGRREFSLDLSSDPRLITPVHKQGRGGERHFWPRWEPNGTRTITLMKQGVEEIP